jgi:signal transduction histidine kinase
MRGLSGAEFVFTDDRGTALASSRSLDLPLPKRPEVVRRWQQLRLGAPVAIGADRYYSMVLAMPGRGLQPPGLLHIFYPEHFWQEARNEAILPPLVVGAIALATTALLALLLANRLTRPILELRAQVNRIALADYQPMPLPRRNDELRDLAVSVNRLAEQLAEMDRAIRRSERLTLVGQLAGGLAHYLRNNVTGARMAVQLHARECDVDPESLTVALRQLALLEENLKQLLAAPQSACETAVKSDVRLTDVVDEVVELVSPSLRHRRIALSVVDHLETGATLHADVGQLRQLLVNLVLNGADAAGPTGRVTIAIETANKEELVDDPQELRLLPPHVVLRVTDSGPGPAPEIAERLFEPFVTNKPEGIGLGLAVSQQIARSHGGSIFFSRQNGETNVEVHLPSTVSDCRDSNHRPCPIS